MRTLSAGGNGLVASQSYVSRKVKNGSREYRERREKDRGIAGQVKQVGKESSGARDGDELRTGARRLQEASQVIQIAMRRRVGSARRGNQTEAGGLSRWRATGRADATSLCALRRWMSLREGAKSESES
jgi:hypothetical protein